MRLVAQVSNLPYRSASSLRIPDRPGATVVGNVLPIGNRRYSRLETCATPDWPDFVNDPVVELNRERIIPIQFRLAGMARSCDDELGRGPGH